MIDPPDFYWYVVQTKSGDEPRVETNLRQQGIEVYLPHLEAYQTFMGKIARKTKPLFPNYLFIRCDLSQHFSRVKWTRGVN